MSGLQDTSPNPLPPEATGAPPSAQSILFKVLSAGFSGALIVLIIVWFHTKLVEYGSDVGDAIKSLSIVQIVGLLIGGVVIMTLNAMAMRAPLTGISRGKAFIAQQSCSAVSNVIPGPSGTAARFAILYSWGVGVEDFTRATVAVSIWSNVCMISMPGLAFLILAISGDSTYDGTNLVVAAIVSVIISIISLAVVAGALRSEAFARWLGRVAARIVNPTRRLFRKPPQTDLPAQAVQLRQRTVDVVRNKATRLTVITVGNYWFNGLMLVLCMWVGGVPHTVLPMLVGLALYSIGRVATIVQVTPGGVGVVEVAYTAVYMTVVPEQYRAQVITGILLYRLLTYIAPILVGGVCYLLWRVMRDREKHAATAAAAASSVAAG